LESMKADIADVHVACPLVAPTPSDSSSIAYHTSTRTKFLYINEFKHQIPSKYPYK